MMMTSVAPHERAVLERPKVLVPELHRGHTFASSKTMTDAIRPVAGCATADGAMTMMMMTMKSLTSVTDCCDVEIVVAGVNDLVVLPQELKAHDVPEYGRHQEVGLIPSDCHRWVHDRVLEDGNIAVEAHPAAIFVAQSPIVWYMQHELKLALGDETPTQAVRILLVMMMPTESKAEKSAASPAMATSRGRTTTDASNAAAANVGLTTIDGVALGQELVHEDVVEFSHRDHVRISGPAQSGQRIRILLLVTNAAYARGAHQNRHVRCNH